MIKQCVICGSEFEARGSTITCSPEHSKANRRKLIRDWNSRNPDKRLQICRVSKANTPQYKKDQHRDTDRERKRRQYENNKEEARQRAVEYRAKNREKISLSRRAEYAKNPEQHRDRSLQWRLENPDKVRKQSLRRQNKIKAALLLVAELESKGLEALL